MGCRGHPLSGRQIESCVFSGKIVMRSPDQMIQHRGLSPIKTETAFDSDVVASQGISSNGQPFLMSSQWEPKMNQHTRQNKKLVFPIHLSPTLGTPNTKLSPTRSRNLPTGRRKSQGRRRESCYWPNATNAQGLGDGSPQRARSKEKPHGLRFAWARAAASCTIGVGR
jgi:hypothetical protein